MVQPLNSTNPVVQGPSLPGEVHDHTVSMLLQKVCTRVLMKLMIANYFIEKSAKLQRSHLNAQSNFMYLT